VTEIGLESMMAEVLFAAQGAPPVSTVVSLTPVTNGKKSSIIKVLIILFEHLWEVELTFLPSDFT
jgi:hypothetical protein